MPDTKKREKKVPARCARKFVEQRKTEGKIEWQGQSKNRKGGGDNEMGDL